MLYVFIVLLFAFWGELSKQTDVKTVNYYGLHHSSSRYKGLLDKKRVDMVSKKFARSFSSKKENPGKDFNNLEASKLYTDSKEKYELALTNKLVFLELDDNETLKI